ncbi:MAG: VOC family protein [Saprospiraceae bacterium]|nr:VOC family protein [Saprospiraceae bacterium]
MSFKIEHLAIWTKDLEKSKDFYIKYFDMKCGDKYHNPSKQFTSYFLSFKNSKVRIELMHRSDILEHYGKKGNTTGLAHIAISVGSKEKVNLLTERLRADNFMIDSDPRTTGDGYYESVVLDPEGNLIEITE